jgi:hypothetical protein
LLTFQRIDPAPEVRREPPSNQAPEGSDNQLKAELEAAKRAAEEAQSELAAVKRRFEEIERRNSQPVAKKVERTNEGSADQTKSRPQVEPAEISITDASEQRQDAGQKSGALSIAQIRALLWTGAICVFIFFIAMYPTIKSTYNIRILKLPSTWVSVLFLILLSIFTITRGDGGLFSNMNIFRLRLMPQIPVGSTFRR